MSTIKDKAQYPKGPISKEDQAKFLKIFSALEADPQAYAFLEPVDYIALNILDYPDVIKNPMDLGTVKKNMQSGLYQSMAALLTDIDLIWENCHTYNMQGSDICKMAQHCEKLFKKQMDKHFKSAVPKSTSKKADEDKEDESVLSKNETLSITEKMELTEKIRLLSNEGLSAVVKTIIKECPKGIEDVDSEKLQIKVDCIDRKTYDLLFTLIESSLQKPSEPSAKEK